MGDASRVGQASLADVLARLRAVPTEKRIDLPPTGTGASLHVYGDELHAVADWLESEAAGLVGFAAEKGGKP